MRLDDFDDGIRVEDQRGGNFGGGFSGGGGIFSLLLGFLPMLLGRKMGCTTILIIAAVGYFALNSGMLQLGEVSAPSSSRERAEAGTDTQSICSIDAGSKEACDTLSSLDQTWAQLLEGYQRPKLAFYSQQGQSGCGAAQSAMGPFYCPADNGVYLDTDFFAQMDKQMGAGGDFARRYVLAHEVGHHIQNLTGTADKVRQMQGKVSRADGNQLQVRMELQADCYAGVWAARNADRIEAGDIEEGMTAANAIGDDTLMQQAGQRPVESMFTHGTSEQRMAALKKGLQTGNPSSCNYFQGIL
ncbi:MAG: neutral zinc metallopeptidase [Sphingorhabdus sp.]